MQSLPKSLTFKEEIKAAAKQMNRGLRAYSRDQLLSKLEIQQRQASSAIRAIRFPGPISRVNKKAVIVALAYRGQRDENGNSLELPAPHNDIGLHLRELDRRGYAKKDIRILSDKDGTPPEDMATHDNIVQAMEELMCGVQRGQRRYFCFSGHRIAVECPHGANSAEGMTKAILGCDIEKPIRDFLFETCLLQRCVRDSHLTIVFDTCSVGTPFNLPWVYRYEPTAKSLALVPSKLNAPTGIGRVIFISASEEHQVAREIKVGGIAYGALSYFLTRDLGSAPNPAKSIRNFLAKIHDDYQYFDLELRQTITIACSVVDHTPFLCP